MGNKLIQRNQFEKKKRLHIHKHCICWGSTDVMGSSHPSNKGLSLNSAHLITDAPESQNM